MARFCLYVASLLLSAANISKGISVVEKNTIIGKSGDKPIGLEELVDSFNGLSKLTAELKETVATLKSENAMILEQLTDVRKENLELDKVIQGLKAKTANFELRLEEFHSDDKCGETDTKFRESQQQKGDVDETGIVTEKKSVSARFKRLVMDSQDPLVAFYATLTQDATNLGPGQNIVFDHAPTNFGNAYHAFHGIFTAPYKGLYMFSGTIGCNVGDNSINVNYVLNGNVVARTRGYKWDMDGHTMLLVLNKGDDFSLQSQGNMGTSNILGNAYSSFAGRLVALLE